jgi:hypothetical protein
VAPRVFTVEEANALLAPLDEILTRAQATLSDLRWTRDQLVDLRIVWGDRLEDPSCPDRREYEGFLQRFAELESRLEAVTSEVRALGAEVKDVELGLVDFAARRDAETVYLCWRKGEPRVGWWHDAEGGYAARQPLDRLF